MRAALLAILLLAGFAAPCLAFWGAGSATSGPAQVPAAIVIGGGGCNGTACTVPNIDDALASNVASGLPPGGTYIGTLSTTLATGTPPFGGSYSLVAHVAGDNCGTGTINNAPFQIGLPDQLQYAGGATAGTTYNICVKATAATGGGSTTQEVSVTVHNLINAQLTYCAGNGGGTGASGAPWQAACLQAAVTAALGGDVLFLAPGNWQLQIANSAVVTGNKAVSLLGSGSGNTFDLYGHPSNPSGAPVGTVSRIYTSGTNGAGGGYFTIGLHDQIGTVGCGSANPGPTIAHLYVDGSLTQSQGNNSQNGDTNATLSVQSCDNTTLNDVRVLQCCAVNPIPSPETNFLIRYSQNYTIRNSIFTMPLSGTSYSPAQVLQTQEQGGGTLDNNSLLGNSWNPIYEDNLNFTRNVTFWGCDSIACTSTNPQFGLAGCSNSGCWNGSTTGSSHFFIRNNLFNAAGGPLDVGGGANDPSTAGIINDLQYTGNWLIGSTTALDSCNYHIYSGCVSNVVTSGVDGMQVNGFTAANNSEIASSDAHLYATGTGCTTQGSGPTCPSSALKNMTTVNYNASQNYLSSPNNQYNSDAYTITPSVSGNFCSGSTGGAWCTTTGFTGAPTASFTVGAPYQLGGVYYAPFANESFTAQYGAVQWLASTAPTTPTSGGQGGTGNPWSYLPPVRLAAAHGSTIYLWVMDSAGHIGAAAPQTAP